VETLFARAGFCTVVRNGTVFLFAQKDALASLHIDDKPDYLLCLAVRAAFEDPDANRPITDDCTPADAPVFSR
jgi:hypothetical protein